MALVHWQGISASPTCDLNHLISLAEAKHWFLLPTTAELTYLNVLVNFVNSPELQKLLKRAPFKLRSIVKAPLTDVICPLFETSKVLGPVRNQDLGFF